MTPSTEADAYGNRILSEKEKERQIVSCTSDQDLPGSTYSLLAARAKKAAKTSMKITWQKVPGASSYTVFGAVCGKNHPFRKLGSTGGTSFTQKGLKKGTYYRYVVMAVGHGKALAVSKTVYAATSGGKSANPKAVKVSRKKLSVKTGKQAKIKGSIQKKSGKLKKFRKIAYESSAPGIASVSSSGRVTGKKKGSCTIFVYAQNGICKKVKVTVG